MEGEMEGEEGGRREERRKERWRGGRKEERWKERWRQRSISSLLSAKFVVLTSEQIEPRWFIL